MKNNTKVGFWEFFARLVLRYRIVFLSFIVLITILLGFQWKNIQFTNAEKDLLPDDNIVNVEYRNFIKTFGDEGNLIVIAIKDKKFFTPKVFVAYKIIVDIKKRQTTELVFLY
jgi:predicted RND superfamily exporter protein